ncbi:MAG: SpoIIE family protein phosphatase [Clostridia bacterium]|nr:SpoIIE family protein phosphatase [Clostridia bacterium]
MLGMIIKMSLVTLLYVAITVALKLWIVKDNTKITNGKRIFVGLLYGVCAILSTHYGVIYEHMALNVRDIAPLAAGLFFDPISGIIAGLIGGVERFIAGTYFGVGSYTRIACSVSTCLAGFLAAALNIKLFKGKKPSPLYALFLGAVMEVFHMYVVFITHRDDMKQAFYVVRTCSIPMIIFTGIGMALCAIVLLALGGKFKNKKFDMAKEKVSISSRLQFWLFICTVAMLVMTFFFSFSVQSRSALQNAKNTMEIGTQDIKEAFTYIQSHSELALGNRHIGENGNVYIAGRNQTILSGDHKDEKLRDLGITALPKDDISYFEADILGVKSYCRLEKTDTGYMYLATLPVSEVYAQRDANAYETAFADILLFSLIFILIYILVQKIVVSNLDRINSSLSKITRGSLNEVVNVRASSEFASLSDDINLTVDALKGYIEQAEKRIEEELEFARRIQSAALPKVFTFPRDEFELYASMDPAKEVGGDFYDFFFVDKNKIALVIADVSGKGIPASLFMMRSMTAIKGFAESGRMPGEIFSSANDTLCEGNEADMFVTAWIGIVDLETGTVKCANAGHEHPIIKRRDGNWELLKDKHGAPLAAMEGMPFKEYELQLEPGDKLFVYTDGVPEAINANEEQYGTGRTVDCLNSIADANMETLLSSLRANIAEFVNGAEQFDDITMLGFEFRRKTE